MVEEINDNNFNEKITQNEKVVVDCYATWCGPCKMLSPIIDELAKELKDVHFYKLNVDENEKTSASFGIMSIPTLLIFSQGNLVNKSIGLKSKEELIKIIK